MVFDRKKYMKKYREKNKERINQQRTEYYQKNKEKIKEYSKKNEERLKAYMKEYREKNREKIKEYYQKNREEILKKCKEYHKEYYQRPGIKARMKEYEKKYRLTHKKQIQEHKRKYQKEYRQKPEVKSKTQKYTKEYYQRPYVKEKYNIRIKKKWKNNERWAIKERIRIMVLKSIKIYSKTGKIMSSKMYGINYKAIIEHLKPFPKDIENYHIDHIIPLSLFDFNKPEHIKIAFNSENHQWLTIKENLEKHNRLLMPKV